MRKIILYKHKKRENVIEQKRTKEAALVWTETLFLLLAFFFTEEKTFCCCPTDAEKVKEDAIVVL